MFVLVIIVAIIAGGIGELLMRSLFFKDLYSTSLGNDLNLSAYDYADGGITIKDPRKVIVNEETRIADTAFGVQSLGLGIYRQATGTIVSTNYYTPENMVALGLPFTSDGWVLLENTDSMKDVINKYQNYVAISKNQKVYQIDQVFVAKKPYPFMLIHLADVSDLTVINFSNYSDLVPGRRMLFINTKGETYMSYALGNPNYQGLRSSELILRDVKLDHNPIADAWVFGLDGNLSALAVNNKVYFAGDVYNLLRNFLKSHALTAPYLGVTYYNLSEFTKKDANSRLAKKGYLLASVSKGSPAEIAGLKVGDVILTINGGEINDLADYLAINFNPLDEVTFEYTRAENKQETKIILGTIK